jgi:hypothetical protein
MRTRVNATPASKIIGHAQIFAIIYQFFASLKFRILKPLCVSS